MPVLQNMISIENPPSTPSPLKHHQLHSNSILRPHQPSASPKSSSKDAKIVCQNASNGLIALVRDARRKRTSSRTPPEEFRPLARSRNLLRSGTCYCRRSSLCQIIDATQINGPCINRPNSLRDAKRPIEKSKHVEFATCSLARLRKPDQQSWS